MTGTTSTAAASLRGGPCDLIPGIVLSAAIATVAYFAAPVVGRVVSLPAMVIALLIGMVLNPFFAARPSVQPGMAFYVRTVLRWAGLFTMPHKLSAPVMRCPSLPAIPQ